MNLSQCIRGMKQGVRGAFGPQASFIKSRIWLMPEYKLITHPRHHKDPVEPLKPIILMMISPAGRPVCPSLVASEIG